MASGVGRKRAVGWAIRRGCRRGPTCGQVRREIYQSLCINCHGAEGRGVSLGGPGQGPVALAPPLARSPRVEGDADQLLNILLSGLTGPVDGKTYAGIMASMAANDDQWIAAVSTYVRREWGNGGSPVTPRQVGVVRNHMRGPTTGPWGRTPA
jgi:mono/diheme cytochrome c family protein